ncbi:hypothetical protein DFH09DRAFT_1114568 [Mycena vulgaris]|nr:hypothetical protein DFH09DRAFT_1114568 [Mycena vulgaris]
MFTKSENECWAYSLEIEKYSCFWLITLHFFDVRRPTIALTKNDWSRVYIPTRIAKLILRSFGDLWELRIDEPGGHFEEVGVEEEARSARAGPWQRCFSCAAAGPWKKWQGRVTGGCSSAAGHVSRRMEGTQGVT